jgi:hypothetical protein
MPTLLAELTDLLLLHQELLTFALGTVATGSSTYWQIGANNTTQFMYINDDACNCTLNDARLISPVFSLAGATGATLDFKHAFSDLDARSRRSTHLYQWRYFVRNIIQHNKHKRTRRNRRYL